VISRFERRSIIRPATAAALFAGCLALSAPARLAAQDVFGHTPENSPYRDVESPSELSIYSGYLVAGLDPAKVTPRSAPIIGIRELIHLDGPAIFFARIAHSFSSRTVIDPGAPAGLRPIGTSNDGITLADLDLGINVTGDRSWHNIMPYIAAGPGVASDLGVRRDVGDYRFGTNFAVTYGGGFRWVPPGRFSVHIDANAYMWTSHYPESYHTTAIDGTQVIPTGRNLNGWRNNGLFALGISYRILH
jgi:hypothetical protein